MVVSNEDIVEVTRRVIHQEGGTSGFATLFENKRMDFSIEKIILEPRYRELFTYDDLQAAYNHLKQFIYDQLDYHFSIDKIDINVIIYYMKSVYFVEMF